MVFAGFDIGAESIKLVILENGRIVYKRVIVSDEEGGKAAELMMTEAVKECGVSFGAFSYIISTGVGGRNVSFANKKKSEQLCHASGAFWLFESARTVIDIGAGGMRAMKLNAGGKVMDFAVNSKCASGTGLFLDAMTRIVKVPIKKMGEMAIAANEKAKVSSYCAVFAESEVISNIHRGVPKENIVAGIHEAVVDRAVELLSRVGINEDVIVTGGVAKNIGVIKALETRLGLNVKVPKDPQIVGALGAALTAQGTPLSPE
jgi:predicted CoA-substrate-specific enzyme activase